MDKYDLVQLNAAIIRSYKCTEKEAQSIANYAKNLDDSLQPVINAWIKDESIIGFEVNGINCQYIMEKLHTHFLDALFHMNEFVKKPQEAERFKRIRITIKDAPKSGGYHHE